jgi:hypothetical protein
MTDEEIKLKADYLKSMMQSPGGALLLKHIEEECKDGWEKFIALPVDKKTSKAAYDAQARYAVLRDLKDWILSEIKIGQ